MDDGGRSSNIKRRLLLSFLGFETQVSEQELLGPAMGLIPISYAISFATISTFISLFGWSVTFKLQDSMKQFHFFEIRLCGLGVAALKSASQKMLLT